MASRLPPGQTCRAISVDRDSWCANCKSKRGGCLFANPQPGASTSGAAAAGVGAGVGVGVHAGAPSCLLATQPPQDALKGLDVEVREPNRTQRVGAGLCPPRTSHPLRSAPRPLSLTCLRQDCCLPRSKQPRGSLRRTMPCAPGLHVDAALPQRVVCVLSRCCWGTEQVPTTLQP
jgi:hypothetical protein